MWPFKGRKTDIAAPARSAFSTHLYQALAKEGSFKGLVLPQPTLNGVAMDSSIDGTVPAFKGGSVFGVPDAQAAWYASQSFIGYNMCAVIAKHWLVDKACNMPARDAIRQGYDLNCENDDGEINRKLRALDKKYRINQHLKDLVHFGRVYGGRLALFVVETSNPQEWYENPFNIDGVTAGVYKGIKQIDPQWVTPDLTDANLQDPASLEFYEPTYWLIGNRRYHKSHLVKFVPYPVSDVLKPTYRYFGVSVPERIYERVYASERTANEAPQLAMTKRLLTIGMADVEGVDKETIRENMMYFVEMRDNYGVQMTGASDTVNQFDTALADLDATIMTQYQLVASGASVPATKLIETTPKGFNATGEYEEGSYREGLESIQTNDLDDLVQRHYDILLRSEGMPLTELSVTWCPLDSPTAAESADIELKRAQTDAAYQGVGAIDGIDIRQKLSTDKESRYYGIEIEAGDNNYGETGAGQGKAGAMGDIPTGGDEGQASALFSSAAGPLSGGYDQADFSNAERLREDPDEPE